MDPSSRPEPGKKQEPSHSELVSSAKVVAGAAKAGLGHEPVDKGKVAGAAADLLDAASHYGKLEDKAVGKYVDKAESYLEHYHNSHPDSTSTKPSSHSDHGHGHGDLLNKAQDFLKKH